MADSSAASIVLRGNAAFANNLYQILSRKEGNVFFSPIGVHICLSMIYQGAEEKTAEILSKVLHIQDAENTALGYKTVMEVLNSIEKVTLLMANKIYAKESKRDKVDFIKSFEQTIKENFYGDVEFLDFEKKKDAVKTMNKWIEEKTKNTIKNMILESFIQESTAIILINAIYFKGEWVKKFEEKFTANEKFYFDNENSTDIKMMHSIASYKYKEDEELGAKILQLPYEGNNVSMIVILPHEKNGINNLERKLASIDFGQVIENLEEYLVVVSLPKFKVQEIIELEDVLKEMGLEDIFNEDKANFRKIIKLTSNENLYVNKVIQKSFIEVNESGTEAAAVTAVKMKIPRCEHKYFQVDHPAIFMLVAHHDTAINVLFYGRLSDPKY